MKYLNNVFSVPVIKLILIWGLLLAVSAVQAEPYLAVKTNAKCSACHVNPIGGGMRTKFGNLFGHTQLPAEISDIAAADIGEITDYLKVGGNFRYNAQATQNDAGEDSSTFRVESAQVYVALTPKNSKFTLYLDQQVAPGAAVNREAFLLYNYSGNHYVKAGKMYVPYGLRLEDDSSFVRQVTGFNFDSSDNGVELGLEYDKASVNFFITNGTSAVSNNDDKFLFGAKAEKLFNNFRVGGTLVVNGAEENEQRYYNLYGGLTVGNWVFLTEANLIETEQAFGPDKEELVSLIEANYQLQKGLNIKVTGEYYDPDRSFSNNQETRYSLVVEYAPISMLQLRAGVRSSEGIPQQPSRTNELMFLQTHIYF
ncbi:hypothetical protein [Agaribacter marinus]|uniref:Porin n=1 Tax=Agaribacter marinus TaxID=1431249 RepID=A0AA37SZX5_9ALTE|nr:hypothetical protein [Agaribacter marinus]GLR72531.1 hypothetical protein GCM10007852_34390 [Agaribacter marinus]